MRMKEDAMMNGQLKPGYNVQAGTENHFIIAYGIFPNPNDTKTLIPFLEKFEAGSGGKLKTVIADAGYGSEQNYDYLESKKINPLVKYSTYHQEKKKSFSKKTYNAKNWAYNRENREYTCPAGNPVPYKETVIKKNDSGFEQAIDEYHCEHCDGCPFRNECTKSEYGRVVQRNENLEKHKEKVRKLLHETENYELMKQRSPECETVFGQTKANQHFRRFRLRGTEKVRTEWGLLALGYNFKGIAGKING